MCGTFHSFSFGPPEDWSFFAVEIAWGQAISGRADCHVPIFGEHQGS